MPSRATGLSRPARRRIDMSDSNQKPGAHHSALTRDDLKLSGWRRECEGLRADLAAAQARIAALEAEATSQARQRAALEQILARTASALKGEPDPRVAQALDDLPAWAADARAVADAYLGATAPGSAVAPDAFVKAIVAWRARTGADLFQSALDFTALDRE